MAPGTLYLSSCGGEPAWSRAECHADCRPAVNTIRDFALSCSLGIVLAVYLLDDGVATSLDTGHESSWCGVLVMRRRRGCPVVEAKVVQLEEESRLFAELYTSLRRFAAVVGPIEVDPDDLLQEAVARVLRRHRLTDLDQPGAYLKKTMVNLASNHRRSMARERRALFRFGASAHSGKDAYPSDVNELLGLSPGERAVLYLSEVEGYRYAEIGRMLGCSEAAARKRAMRGRRRLYSQLAGEVTDG